jgi:thiol-disulfide isomerase/thioredoxin
MLLKALIRALSIAAIGLFSFAAQALTIDDYSPAAIKKAEAAGQSYALAFHADWCPTCKQQAKVFEQLKADPALKNVTVYNVDYDGETDLKKALKVRGQSTVIAYKGAKETARSVADTSVDGLKQLLSKSL